MTLRQVTRRHRAHAFLLAVKSATKEPSNLWGAMIRKLLVAFALVLAASLVAGDPVRGAEATGKAQYGAWGVDLTGMDTSVAPGDDFNRYVNGRWYDAARLPPDRPLVGSASDLALLAGTRMYLILRDLDTRESALSADERKVRDLYRSFMDTARIEQLGLAPAQRDLAELGALRTHDDVARAMASVSMMTQSAFNIAIGPNARNPNAYVVTLVQSGLGLPDREYYLRDDQVTRGIRAAYRQYITRMLMLGGTANAQPKANAILALETALARVHWPAVERRDVQKTYNPMTISELERFAPEFSWRAFFGELGLENPHTGERTLVVREKSAFPKIAQLFRATPVPVWRDYLIFHYLSDHAAYLPKRFDEAWFEMFGRELGGTSQQLSREERGSAFVDDNLGEVIGKVYVQRYFPPEARASAQKMVGNIIAALRARIGSLTWMSETTRARALQKLATMRVKIGYPDKWRDYSSYAVDPGDLMGNVARGAVFEWNRRLKRLDDPVDRDEWSLTPQTVDAYYRPTLNEIVFPAAILQPPLFDPNADDAVNYGGIGSVIGHEIGHGFDDQGSRFDSTGTLENWWTDLDRAAFDQRTAGLVTQYNGYSPLPGLHVNGQLTLGENIGDMSGLSIAYEAYRRSLGGRPAPVLDGFTGEQRFFLGWAQVWRERATDGYVRRGVISSTHSPAQFRVNGSVRNVDGWYDAFKVQPGNRLYLPPNRRIQIW